MTITKVYVDVNVHDRNLLATASVVFCDVFVVHDFRLIEHNGKRFVGMPSRLRMYTCGVCSKRNKASARFCNDCGSDLVPVTRNKAFYDMAHPVNAEFHATLTDAIFAAYEETLRCPA